MRIQLTYTKGLFFIGLIYISYSCKYTERRNERQLLAYAEIMVEDKPESALSLIDSIDVLLLNDRQYAHYVIMKIRAKERAGLDISADTSIFQVRDYLVKTKNSKDAALACFVSALVYDIQGRPGKAIPQYEEAAKWAGKGDDYKLTSYIYYNLARILYLQHIYKESLDNSKIAKKYEELANSRYEYKIYTLELIAANYLYLHKQDSAIHYFDKALELAIVSHDAITHRRLLYYLARTFCENGDYEMAREKCFKALTLTKSNDTINLGRSYLTLANIYNGMEFNDSTLLYAYKAKEMLGRIDDPTELAELYQILSLAEEKNKNYEKALQYEQLHIAYVKSVEYAKNAILEEQKKYYNDTITITQKERDKYQIQRQLYFFVMLSSVLTVILTGYIFYNNRKKLKKKITDEISGYRTMISQYKEQTEKEKIAEIKSIRKMANDEKLKMLFHINDIAELNKLVNSYDTDKHVRRHVKKMVERLSWDEIYCIINEANEGLLDRFRVDFNALSESEYRNFCMAYAGFGCLTISSVLSESYYTSRNRQTDLRKKLGMEAGGSFREFLNKKYGII